MNKNKAWKEWEENILRSNYPQKGGVDKCKELLPERTKTAIKVRARLLGLRINEGWTPEEDAIIKKYFPYRQISYWMGRLPNRTEKAIWARGWFLCQDETKWTPKEDEIIREWYPQKDGMKMCMKLLPKRSKEMIRARALVLGVKRGRKNAWKPEEEEIVKEYYPQKNGLEKCMKRLDKSERAIRWRAKVLGVKTSRVWSEEEIAIIKKWYPKEGCKKCLELLPEKNKRQIYEKAHKLGVKKFKNQNV